MCGQLCTAYSEYDTCWCRCAVRSAWTAWLVGGCAAVIVVQLRIGVQLRRAINTVCHKMWLTASQL